MTQTPFYDALASDYDRFVNWEGRLAHELPFLERLFADHGVRRVLDVACGTGHHAIALTRRGYQVLGTDLSALMVEQAERNAAAGVKARFVVAGFGGLAALGETFDAVLCLGSSLPHVLTEKALVEALADFAAVLHPGGLVVIQNRNFDRVWRRRERFMGPQSHREGEQEWVFVRFYDFHEATVTFNMIRLRRNGGAWTQDVESTELRPIFCDELATALGEAGFFQTAFYGGYDSSPFDPAHSGDLIAVARK
ncbi:MAG: class I SAM-dependent methyltransferase [Anaerolineae bacterium]|nr:class I SAM-dependent methyltransferase [Anaerolineae bacterium]